MLARNTGNIKQPMDKVANANLWQILALNFYCVLYTHTNDHKEK